VVGGQSHAQDGSAQGHGAAAASSISWPLAVNAQSSLPVIGWINMRPRARAGATAGFVDGLRDAGLVEDRDFIIDYRPGSSPGAPTNQILKKKGGSVCFQKISLCHSTPAG
jgi:hypothetical protein